MIDVISGHGPRAAGSTFNWILQQVYADALHHDYVVECTRQYFEVERVPASFRAVHGDFPVGKSQAALP